MIVLTDQPTTYSRDHYLRIKARDLHAVELSHSYSVLTSVSPNRGYTEWTAVVDSCVLSVAWEWTCLDDGCIARERSCPVMSNLMLIEEGGYDLGMRVTEEALFDSVDRLDWKPVVALGCAIFSPP